MKKRRRRKAKKVLLSMLLLLLATACICGMLYVFFQMQKKREAEQFKKYTEQLEQEEQRQAEQEQEERKQEAEVQPQQEETVTETPTPPPVLDSGAPIAVGEQTFLPGFTVKESADTILVGDTDVLSKNAILVDLSTDQIIAKKGTDERIYPASMTKILTILVAAEHIENFDDTFTMTPEIVNESLSNGCSAAGFVPDEVIPVKDLFYGTILPSGGEAAIGLAVYTAGSHDAFVAMMNEKLAELGLSETTHFTNCVGIYNENHYSTMRDMAMILKAAVENEFCRNVLQERVYYTTKTPQNPEGIILSNWFLRKIEDKDSGVTCAKTGFVNESGFCAASYYVSATGRPYICVTVDTYNEWRCIYDHVAMYKLYAS